MNINHNIFVIANRFTWRHRGLRNITQILSVFTFHSLSRKLYPTDAAFGCLSFASDRKHYSVPNCIFIILFSPWLEAIFMLVTTIPFILVNKDLGTVEVCFLRSYVSLGMTQGFFPTGNCFYSVFVTFSQVSYRLKLKPRMCCRISTYFISNNSYFLCVDQQVCQSWVWWRRS